jgi:hypothetical protein
MTRHIWEDNIKMDIKDMACEGMDWTHGTGFRQVVIHCQYGKEPSDSIKCGEFLDRVRNCKLLTKDSAPCA